MSETTHPTGGLTRRGFLKGAGVTAGALGLAGAASMTATDGWLAPAKANAEPEEHIGYIYHQNHCGGNCSLKCTARDGRLAIIEPNDGFDDPTYSTCCLKGLSEIQHVYSIERIQSPLKRVGERGEGKFEAISWDEAYQILMENLEALWSKYGKESVYLHTSTESAKHVKFLPGLLGCQTGGKTGIDMGIGNGFDPAVGPSKGTSGKPGEHSQVGAGYAMATNEARDLVNSDFILIVGDNYLETSLAQSNRFFHAKDAGAYIATVDPHFSTTAQKSDEWIPIEPGTDAALYMGLCSEILEKGLYDIDFMRERTSFPFLVNAEDGLLLKEEIPGETEEDDPTVTYFVWDEATNSAKRVGEEIESPALEGSFGIDGQTYVTVFDMLKEAYEPYSVEWASELTGIPQETIRDIARRYATSNASALITGYGGNDKMSNADIVGHALAVLVALTGQIGRPGAFAGCVTSGGRGYVGSLASWKMPEELASLKPEVVPYDMPFTENKVRGYIAYSDTVSTKMANMGESTKWLQGLDFVCVIDMYHMPTTEFADLVLPVCTKFEDVEPYGGVLSANGHVLLRQKILDPLFDSKTDFQIQCDIAELLGLRDALPATCEEWIRYQLDNTKDESVKGITLESLVNHQCVQEQSCQSEPRRHYTEKFGTSSGKMEVYYEDLLPFGQEVPRWEACVEVYDDNPLKEAYPLQYIQTRSRYRIHNQFFDSTWINQYNQFCVELNGVDMEARGLSSDDTVEVFNDRGRMVCPVRRNEAVRPGCARVIEGVWGKYLQEGGFQYLTNSDQCKRGSKLMMGPVIPFNDTLVEVRKVEE